MSKVLLAIFLTLSVSVFSQTEQCTIGVASGESTPDGRPMIWKTRDYTELNNEVRYNNTMKYPFIFVAAAGSSTSARMGVSAHGLAIVNSTSSDLPDGSDTGLLNGELIRDGLGTCLTVDEFETLLINTNEIGRRTNGNFAVIDSSGGAAIFEVGEKVYWRFDASDDQKKYVLRTNFAVNGGGSTGIERLIRSVALVSDFSSGDSLNHKSILRYQMRDFSDNSSEKISIPFKGTWSGRPYGYIPTNVSICRNNSVSASVIHGVLPTENPLFSTMWTILGQPATSIALPYWPIGYTPGEANGIITAPLCDISLQIKNYLFDNLSDEKYINSLALLDGNGGGLWTKTFPYEDIIFSKVESLMNDWRTEEDIPYDNMRVTEDTLALKTYEYLQTCYDYLIGTSAFNKEEIYQSKVYPNPFVSKTTLRYSVSEVSNINIELYTLTGVLIEKHTLPNQLPGDYNYILENSESRYPEGMLLLKLFINADLQTHKIINIPF